MATAKQIKTLQVRLDATFGKGKVKATEDTWSKNKAALDTMEAAGKVPILDQGGTLRQMRLRLLYLTTKTYTLRSSLLLLILPIVVT